MRKKILIIIGTRPEAIKMAPVYNALVNEPAFAVELLNSGQHDELIGQAFEAFDFKPDHTLALPRVSHDMPELYALLFDQLRRALSAIRPDGVLVHGDTATAAVASMAAFLQRIPVAHVEAGLRSFRREEPWPEEVNRKIVDMVADLYLAPTALAKQNLKAEGVPENRIAVTGNTVVDALLHMARHIQENPKLASDLEKEFGHLGKERGMILVTGHRQENFGANLRHVVAALKRLAVETGCDLVLSVHPNRKLQDEMDTSFLSLPNVYALPALSYPKFVYLMQRCSLIISDSGGIQEEAPTFGKKVLVTRNVTERPEGIDSGFLEMVGCDAEVIISHAKAILSSPQSHRAPNPYGDGRAATRIRDLLVERWADTKTPMFLAGKEAHAVVN